MQDDIACDFASSTSGPHINGLVQDFSNPCALAMELLQSCTKLSM